MKHTITITFETDAPDDRINEMAARMATQLEDLDDPDYSFVDEEEYPDFEPVAYPYSNVEAVVNGKPVITGCTAEKR